MQFLIKRPVDIESLVDLFAGYAVQILLMPGRECIVQLVADEFDVPHEAVTELMASVGATPVEFQNSKNQSCGGLENVREP